MPCAAAISRRWSISSSWVSVSSVSPASLAARREAWASCRRTCSVAANSPMRLPPVKPAECVASLTPVPMTAKPGGSHRNTEQRMRCRTHGHTSPDWCAYPCGGGRSKEVDMPVHFASGGTRIHRGSHPAIAAAPAPGRRGNGDAMHVTPSSARHLRCCVCPASKRDRIPRRNRAQPRLPERYTRAMRRTKFGGGKKHHGH
jgi:hypothetical protein